MVPVNLLVSHLVQDGEIGFKARAILGLQWAGWNVVCASSFALVLTSQYKCATYTCAVLSALATAGFRRAYVPIEDREFGKYVRHTAISVALIKLKAVSIQDEIYGSYAPKIFPGRLLRYNYTCL